MIEKLTTKAILTKPEKIKNNERLVLTGNEYVSLPHIDLSGGIRSLNVLRLDQLGLLEFSGPDQVPLVAPVLKIGEDDIRLEELAKWEYRFDWLPRFTAVAEDSWSLTGEIVAPPGFKGFYYRIAIENKGSSPLPLQLGWKGSWDSFNYVVFNRRPVEGNRSIIYNRWTDSLVLEASSGPPLAALALSTGSGSAWEVDSGSGTFRLIDSITLDPDQSYESVLYLAVNLEADGAATSTVDLRRHGQPALEKKSRAWLESRRVAHEDSTLQSILNRNLFFCYFYSLARSLDSEILVPVTSRSPRYYVSAAFWSRDALLWSFPAVLLCDQETAREMLLNCYRRHARNAGDHAHYINGTILYPGFELDQLAAFFLALKHYLDRSDDRSILAETPVKAGLNLLAEKALAQFDPDSGLYGTFLDPSDDPVPYPFLTYNNALLYCSFRFLADLQKEELWFNRSDFAILARELQQAIYEHCIVKGPFGAMFAWSVDGKGRFTLYDNPPGSLQLLAHYGFCSETDLVYINTIHWARSSNNRYFYYGQNFEEAGSLHAPSPWPLAACNNLLACNVGAEDFLRRAQMDNGFFCETVDPLSGVVSTGAAFASAAGFLAFALANAKPEKGCRDIALEGDEPDGDKG